MVIAVLDRAPLTRIIHEPVSVLQNVNIGKGFLSPATRAFGIIRTISVPGACALVFPHISPSALCRRKKRLIGYKHRKTTALAPSEACPEWCEIKESGSEFAPRRGSSPSSDVHHQTANHRQSTPRRSLPPSSDVPVKTQRKHRSTLTSSVVTRREPSLHAGSEHSSTETSSRGGRRLAIPPQTGFQTLNLGPFERVMLRSPTLARSTQLIIATVTAAPILTRPRDRRTLRFPFGAGGRSTARRKVRLPGPKDV